MKFSTLLPSVLMATSVAVAANTFPAQALSFGFSGSDAGGTGSATMDFTGLGTNAVTVDLFNTSSTTLDNGSGVNAPAITKFGFNFLGEPDPKLLNWELKAFDSNKQLVTIGSSANSKLPWSINFDDKLGNLTLDYMAETNDVKGGIYNPNATAGLAAKPNFFSKATLSLSFAANFTLDKASTFVRMQNVGLNGTGSLKLTGTEIAAKPPVVVEQPPVVVEQPPVVVEQPPVVVEQPPVVVEKPPVVEEKPPVVEEKPPVVEEKPPVVEEKPPANEKPPVEEKSPGNEKPPAEEVPEPLTILGSAAALGFGAKLKKQADKNKNQAAAKDTMSV